MQHLRQRTLIRCSADSAGSCTSTWTMKRTWSYRWSSSKARAGAPDSEHHRPEPSLLYQLVQHDYPALVVGHLCTASYGRHLLDQIRDAARFLATCQGCIRSISGVNQCKCGNCQLTSSARIQPLKSSNLKLQDCEPVSTAGVRSPRSFSFCTLASITDVSVLQVRANAPNDVYLALKEHLKAVALKLLLVVFANTMTIRMPTA